MKVAIADSSNMKNIAKLHPNGIRIIAYDFDSAEVLEKLGIEFERANNFVSSSWHKKVGKYATVALREWGKIKINGVQIKDLLTVEGMPFWDIIESSISTRFFESSKRLFNIELLKRVIKRYRPESIIITGGSDIENVARCISKDYETKIETIGKVIPHINLKPVILDYFFRYANIVKERGRRVANPDGHIFHGQKKRIVVFLTIETEFPIVYPVIERLKDNYDLIIVRTGSLRERMKKTLERNKIESIPIEYFVDKNVKKKVKKIAKTLNERWTLIKGDVEFRKGMGFSGLNVYHIFMEDFNYYFSTRKRINEIVRNTEAFRCLIEKLKPDLVLGLDDISDIGKPVSFALKDMRIPFVILQHGLFGDWSQIYGPSVATINCVWGPYVKSMFSRNWYDPRTIIVTGCPKFDVLAKTKYDDALIRDELGLNENKRTVLFISSVIKYIDTFAPLFFENTKDILKNEQVIIKLHPREYREKFYKNLGKKMGLNIKVLKNFDLYKLIKISDVVVTLGSTVGTEALIMKKPVLVVNFTGEMSPYLESYKKSAFCAKTSEELRELLEKILYCKSCNFMRISEGAEKFIYNHAYKIDGKSAERVVKVIEKLIGG